MPNYRRAYVPGGTFFITIVTYRRRSILAEPENVARLRTALRQVMGEAPFHIPAAVVLPDHAHFLWCLPQGDSNYPRRVGQMKILFTRSMQDQSESLNEISRSRHRHRESNIWQRRYWEHTVRNEDEFEAYLDYIHYNPVKHSLTTCPHLWPFSSFGSWVRAGYHAQQWGCRCEGRMPILPAHVEFSDMAGE